MDTHRLVVGEVVEQHVEEAAALADLRRFHVRAPHVNLEHLARLDERLAAHLDGVKVAGEAGWKYCEQSLAAGRAGNVFVATVSAIEVEHEKRMQTLLALAESSVEARPGFLSALGWVETDMLRQIGSMLLSSANPFSRYTGIVGCAMHGVDPGLILVNALKSPDPLLRARAFRAAGELGRMDLLGACTAAVREPDESSRFWAAWSAVRLGNRATALEVLMEMYRRPNLLDRADAAAATGPSAANDSSVQDANGEVGRVNAPNGESAINGTSAAAAASFVLLALELPRAHSLLSEVARDQSRIRQLITGAGLVGDSIYIPWLLEQMVVEPVARLAGEAFTMITGADLEALDLESDPPEVVSGEPNDDAEDLLVDMDPDDGLPWPDADKVQRWWKENKARFATGVRTFMGEPLSTESCQSVLRNGYQRQRRIAALHLSLQNPNSVMFECRAPASRQRRRLS
jgi:hypothetical protein